MKRLALVVATAGGAGYVPVAPGTAGAAVGVLVYALARPASAAWQIGVLLLLVTVGIWAGSVAGRHFGRDDPGQVVIDEVAGQFLTLLGTGASPLGIALGFLVFRALDIAKPWPARSLERLHGGLGIMADDIMVAVYANVTVRLAQTVLPGLF